MKLKYIELQGFKTFPDRVKIQFDEKISVIVGPNGCGKSNIVDAIRFIAGEQNLKELRLKNMNELVFNGSASNSKKASTVAVAKGLFLNDGEIDFKYKDFSEIAAERRHFKDGESEYRLNGIIVPYREYVNFFIESGISFKFYSILDPLKISSILNYKPEEMRLLFEEASGVIKFKNQKKIALRKLENTNANLARIKDIYSEVEKQEKTLKTQSEELERYKKISEEKRYCEFILYDRARSKANSTIDENKKAVDKFSAAGQNLDNQLILNENSIIKEKTYFNELNEKFKLRTDSKNKFIIEISGMNSDMQHAEEKLSMLHTEKIKKDNELKESETFKNRNILRLEELKHKKEEFESAFKKNKEAASSINDEIKQKKKYLEEIKNELEILNDEILIAVERSQMLNNKISFNQKNIAAYSSRISNYIQLINKLKEEIEVDESLLSSKNNIANSIAHTLNALEDKLRLKNNEAGIAAKQAEELRCIYGKYEKELIGLKSHESRLLELLEQHEGFSEGSKKLLDKSDEFNILGSIGDILEVSDGYEKIIWEAAGDKLETILIADIKDAKNAAEYLNLNDSGSAKLFILKNAVINNNSYDAGDGTTGDKIKNLIDNLKLLPLKDKIKINFTLKHKDNTGINNNNNSENNITISENQDDKNNNDKENKDDVPFDLTFHNAIIEKLAVNFYYAENTDLVFDYINNKGCFPEINIISKDGTIFLSSGFIKAGKDKKTENENILLNKNKLVQLKANISTAEYLLNQKKSEILIKENIIKEINEETENIKVALQSDKIRKITEENDIKHINGRITKSKERLNILKKELENILADKNKLDDEINQSRYELESIESILAEQNIQKKKLDIKLIAQENECEETKEQEVKLRIELSSSENNLLHLAQEIKNIESGIKSGIFRYNKIKNEIDDLNKTVEAIKENILVKKNKIDELNIKLIKISDDIKELDSDLEKIKFTIEEKNLISEKLRREKNDIEKKIENSLTYIQMFEEKLNELNVYGFIDEETEKYVSILKATDDKFYVLNDSELKKTIIKLKNEMDAAGNINMNAAEEYAEVLNRLSFLSSQNNDLNESIKSLENIIKKLDAVSREKFNSDMNKFREKFNELFNYLFGGGHADIVSVRHKSSLAAGNMDEENSLSVHIMPLSDINSGSAAADAAGIEINVQIPGKKLSGLNLLSQGEKVLVTVSLIFAIFLVKKSPFCVIDEVDAPLDDANNARFNKLIKEVSNSSQIIIVTHNKKTMEIGSHIFGITAREPGVSKVVSVTIN
jgi:chromosome segregation protein